MHSEPALRVRRILTEGREPPLRSVCDLARTEITTRRHRRQCPHMGIRYLPNKPHAHRARFSEALSIPSRVDASSVTSALRKLLARPRARQVGNAQIGSVFVKGWLTEKAVSPNISLPWLVKLSRLEIQPGPAVATALRERHLHAALSVPDYLPTLVKLAKHVVCPKGTLGPPLVSRSSALLPDVSLVAVRTSHARRGPLPQARAAGLPAATSRVIGDVAVDLSFTKRRDGFGMDARGR